MLNETNTAWVEIKQEHFFNLSGYTSFLKWNKWKFNNLFWLCEQNSVIHGKFKSNYSYEMKLLITYTRKNAQPVQGWWKQPWTMLCCPHCSMLSTILFSIVTPDCGLIQAQHWRILSKSRYYKEGNVQSKKCQANRRWFVSIRHGRHVLSQCPKQRHSPPGNIKKCLIIPGGECLSLGHWLRTWRPWRMLTNHQRIAWHFFLSTCPSL